MMLPLQQSLRVGDSGPIVMHDFVCMPDPRLVKVEAYAQAPTPQLELHVQGPPTEPPTIIAGTDLGFRIDRHRGNTPIGRIVIRVNGEWVEVEDAMAVKRLTAR